MKRADYVSVLAAAVAFQLGFLACGIFSITVPLYAPVARTWTWQRGGELQMDWYGRVLVALACALGVWIPSTILRRGRSVSDESVARWTAWLVTAMALAMGLQLFQLVGRQVHPEPLPADYQPR